LIQISFAVFWPKQGQTRKKNIIKIAAAILFKTFMAPPFPPIKKPTLLLLKKSRPSDRMKFCFRFGLIQAVSHWHQQQRQFSHLEKICQDFFEGLMRRGHKTSGYANADGSLQCPVKLMRGRGNS
jgi:hypothetical protein